MGRVNTILANIIWATRLLWLYLREFYFIMTENRDNLLLNLEVRVRQVLLLCDKLKQENTKLKDEVVLKDDKIGELEETIGVMNEKYDNLKMARTITAASVDVDEAKLKLSKMVREVDKCIGLLKR